MQSGKLGTHSSHGILVGGGGGGLGLHPTKPVRQGGNKGKQGKRGWGHKHRPRHTREQILQ